MRWIDVLHVCLSRHSLDNMLLYVTRFAGLSSSLQPSIIIRGLNSWRDWGWLEWTRHFPFDFFVVFCRIFHLSNKSSNSSRTYDIFFLDFILSILYLFLLAHTVTLLPLGLTGRLALFIEFSHRIFDLLQLPLQALEFLLKNSVGLILNFHNFGLFNLQLPLYLFNLGFLVMLLILLWLLSVIASQFGNEAFFRHFVFKWFSSDIAESW